MGYHPWNGLASHPGGIEILLLLHATETGKKETESADLRGRLARE